MRKSIGLLFVILFMTLGALKAQSVSIENIKKFALRNVGEIYKDNQVKGYYAFYKIEKIDRKTDAYLLDIYDENLGQVSSTRIPGSKFLFLMEAAFADRSLMFKFYNLKTKEVSFVQYGATGEVLSETVRKVRGMWEKAFIDARMKADDEGGLDLFAVPGKGFITFEGIKNKKLGYEITYTPEEKGQKGWNIGSDPNSKLLQNILYLASNKNLLVNTVAKRPGVMSKKLDYFVQGIDMNTGKKRFEFPLSDKENTISLLNGYMDEENERVVLLGLYFKPGAKVMSDKSLGMCAIELDYDGNEIRKTLISWGKDVAKFLPVDEKGRIEDVGFLYFHKFVRTSDGKIYAIAEQYRKAVSAGGIALNALAMASGGSSNVSNFKIVVENMVIMEFNPIFDLLGIDIYEKGKSNIMLPAGAGYYGPQLLSVMVNSYGGFDYAYTQVNEDKSIYSVAYIDYDRLDKDKGKGKGNRKEVYLGTINYDDGEFGKDKMPLITDRNSAMRVFPAKPGYVMILEYNSKSQNVGMRLEKINF